MDGNVSTGKIRRAEGVCAVTACAACRRTEPDVKLACSFQEQLLRTPAVADSKHEETFKVVDRRLFGEDGELRQDVVEQERRNEEAAEKKAAAEAQKKAGAAAASSGGKARRRRRRLRRRTRAR